MLEKITEELSKPIDKRFGVRDNERYNIIKKLIEEGRTISEIADEIGVSYSGLRSYLMSHIELSKPKDKRVGVRDNKRYETVRRLIGSGMNQREVAEIVKISPAGVGDYIRKRTELKEIYLENRKYGSTKK